MNTATKTLVALGALGVITIAVIEHVASTRRLARLEGELDRLSHSDDHRADPSNAAPLPREGRLAHHTVDQAPRAQTGAVEIDGTMDESDDESAQVEEVSPADQNAYLSTVFDEQTIDRGWALESETNLEGKILLASGDSALSGVECRADLCKAQLRHPDKSEFDGFLDRLFEKSHELWAGEISYFGEDAEEGGMINTIYFARVGTVMPEL